MALLAGKKTYLVCVLAIVYAVSAYLTGNIEFDNAVQLVLAAAGGAALRNGIK